MASLDAGAPREARAPVGLGGGDLRADIESRLPLRVQDPDAGAVARVTGGHEEEESRDRQSRQGTASATAGDREEMTAGARSRAHRERRNATRASLSAGPSFW